jgi:hypothetical protein
VSYQQSKEILLDGEVSQIIERYESQEHFKPIGSGRFASVHNAKWMGTPTTYVIKKFYTSSKDNIIDEVRFCLLQFLFANKF